MNINVKKFGFSKPNYNKKKLQCLILFKCWTLLLSKKKPDHYFSFTSRNENFLDQKVYLFYLKSLQSKNVILLCDFINFMNFGDGQFWFYKIIVCNILVEPPLPLDNRTKSHPTLKGCRSLKKRKGKKIHRNFDR